MAVILKSQSNDLAIEVIAKDGEVRLRCNGHDFVRCYTDVGDFHAVEIVDVDTGATKNHSITALCWRR